MISEAVAIREEFDTIKQKVAHLAIKYEDQYPDLLQSYTLTMLLYVREYEWMVTGEVSLDGLIDLAENGPEGMVNFTSLHRAITEVKRDFQTPALRKAALEREAFWGEAIGWNEEVGV